VGFPGLLVVDGVDAGDLEEPGIVRLHRRVQTLDSGSIVLLLRGGSCGGGAGVSAAVQNPSPVRRRRVTEKRKPRHS
jgi:hypothetical protein